MQKAFTANIDEVDPMKKAIQSVKDVIVIEGPAWSMPLMILYLGGKVNGC